MVLYAQTAHAREERVSNFNTTSTVFHLYFVYLLSYLHVCAAIMLILGYLDELLNMHADTGIEIMLLLFHLGVCA